MLKKKLFIFLLIFLALPLATAYVCQDVTDPSNIPCEAITPYIEGNCTIYNYTITNLTNNSILETGNMTPVGDGTYNFTFNYSTKGDYGIVICDESTATIVVASENVFITVVILLVSLSLFLVFWIGKLEENNKFLFFLLFFSSLIFLVILSEVMRQYLPSFQNYIFPCFYILLTLIFISFVYFAIFFIFTTIKAKNLRIRQEQGLE